MKSKELLTEGYTGYEINSSERAQLLDIYPPKYSDVIVHHITETFPATAATPVPEEPQVVQIIGYRDDGKGLECYVVSIDGRINRPAGGLYHITWSLDRKAGYKPVHSNRVLADLGYENITPRVIRVKPKKF